ncbi:MAG: hypothetical protein LAP61_22980 [Acidobacteriia bacterium]|nr:hypothetical protein [Terriglobia bacterium]
MPTSQASTSTPTSRETADTHEKRIATVAWRWNRQYRYDADYKARGFSDDEIREGNELGQAMEDEYSKNRRCYGDPAYGSWPDHAQQPIKNKIRAMLRGESEPKATPAAKPVSAPAVVVTTLAYELISRAAKARTMANFLHQGGLAASDAERMSPSMWRAFCGSLRQHGVLGKYSTTPSQATIARTIAELRKLEQLIPVCGAVRISHLPEAA